MRLVWLALGWCGGIAFAANRLVSAEGWMIGVILTLILCLLVGKSRRWIMILFAAFCFGGLRFAFHPVSDDVSQYIDAGGLTLEGMVISDPIPRDDRILIRLQTETVTRTGTTLPTSGIVLIDAPPDVNLAYGNRIRATGDLYNPGMIDLFSYSDYLARQGIHSIMSNTAVEITSTDAPSTFSGALIELRHRASDAINAAIPEPNASLLIGILLGDESSISPDVEDAFNATGAAHVIAISGFNMVILSSFVGGMLKGAFPNRRRTAAFIGIVVIALYTMLVGGSAGVVRAALMSGLMLVGEGIRRKTFTPASLSFAALILSAENPTVLWDLSFQYSFFAVVGIALFAEPFKMMFNRVIQAILPHRIAPFADRFLSESFSVGLAAQIGVVPLVALHFSRFSLVSIPVNILIAPVQPLILLIGGAAVLIALVVPLIGTLLLWLTVVPLAWTIGIVRLFTALSFASISFYPNVNTIAALYITVIGLGLWRAAEPDAFKQLFAWMKPRQLRTTALVSGSGLIVLIAALWMSRPDGLLHVWLLAMDDSNAVLIQTPNGAHILIDGGRYPARLLTALGDHIPFNKRWIDVWVLTQPDEKQYAALFEVIPRYEIGAALYHGQENQSEIYAQLWEQLADVPIVTATAGYSIVIDDGARIEVLHPRRTPNFGDDVDDGALTLRLTYGEASFLFPSDLSTDGQETLIESGILAYTNVIELPAHGIARSLEMDFFRVLTPQIALVGGDDPPDPDILNRLSVPIYRTDQGGTLHLWTDGQTLWLQPEHR